PPVSTHHTVDTSSSGTSRRFDTLCFDVTPPPGWHRGCGVFSLFDSPARLRHPRRQPVPVWLGAAPVRGVSQPFALSFARSRARLVQRHAPAIFLTLSLFILPAGGQPVTNQRTNQSVPNQTQQSKNQQPN